MNTSTKLTASSLDQFTGTENWHRHGIVRNVLFTDGAKFVADEGGAYWLLDAIALSQVSEPSVAAEEFQVWTLKVGSDHAATLTCGDGNHNVVYTQRIAFTDFPLVEIALWFANDTIYLPSEH